MNVTIMGAGGVGGYLGALLARAGHAVTVVARGPHLAAIQRDGLHIETAIEPHFTAEVRAVETADTPADLLLFTVKSYDTADAIRLVPPAVGPDTVVLTLQNGVGGGELLAETFGWERVLEGVVYIESHVKAPGIIEQAGGPRRVVFGKRGGNAEREQRLIGTLRDAGWEAELAENVLNALWAKLSFIGPFAALNTITGLKGAQICAAPDTAELAKGVIAEYVAVANAEGAELDANAVETSFGRLSGFAGLSSMFRDRFAGKRIESDALAGVVVRKGEALGIPTPLTRTLSALLSPMREGGAVPGD